MIINNNKKKTGKVIIHSLPKLKFGIGNAKLSNIGTFSIPAGHTCPYAKDCLSKANRLTGKIIDGKHCKIRCFAATAESVFPTARAHRWYNFDLLREASTIEKMTTLINRSLPKNMSTIRIHVSGDYYNESYFLAWLNVAYNNPLKVFYGYTKANPFLIEYKKHIPSNFRFTASKGGTCDNLIEKHKMKFAEIVFSVKEAKQKGLEIDHDDSLAYGSSKSFALLIHGTQPAGSDAGKALSALKKQGLGFYNEETKKINEQEKQVKIYVTLNKSGIRFIPTKSKQINYR